MARSGSSQKVANGLMAMSSAAVLAVYSAGYVRTRPAADRLAKQALERTLAREVPPDKGRDTGRDAAPEVIPPVAASPAPGAHSNPPPKRTVAPKLTTPFPSTATSAPAEKPEPVAATLTSIIQVAEPSANPPAAPVAPSPVVWKDGKYIGWGGSRHGDIQATVVIESGRIVSAEITDCQTRYPCDVIEKLPAQVITRQSPNVQRVSGATESADAFYSAVYFALKQAQ